MITPPFGTGRPNGVGMIAQTLNNKINLGSDGIKSHAFGKRKSLIILPNTEKEGTKLFGFKDALFTPLGYKDIKPTED